MNLNKTVICAPSLDSIVSEMLTLASCAERRREYTVTGSYKVQKDSENFSTAAASYFRKCFATDNGYCTDVTFTETKDKKFVNIEITLEW